MNRKMRTILPITLPFLSCLLLLPACTEENQNGTLSAPGWEPLRIASIAMDGSATPRSIIETVGKGTGELSSIGVYAAYSDGAEYKPAHGSNTDIYQYDGSQWSTTATHLDAVLRLPTATGAPGVTAYAWHPSDLTPVYQSNGGSHVTGVAIPNQITFDAANQNDYLYATPASVQAGTAASFTMNHALLKLTCKIYKSSSLTEEIHLTSLSITERNNNWLTGQGSMRLADGVLSGLTNTSKLVITADDTSPGYTPKVVPDTQNSPTTVHCLLAPTSVTGLRFELEAKSSVQTYSFQSNFVTPTKTDGAKGEHIIVTIKLDGMDAKVTGISVYKWEPYSDTYIPVTPEPET